MINSARWVRQRVTNNRFGSFEAALGFEPLFAFPGALGGFCELEISCKSPNKIRYVPIVGSSIDGPRNSQKQPSARLTIRRTVFVTKFKIRATSWRVAVFAAIHHAYVISPAIIEKFLRIFETSHYRYQSKVFLMKVGREADQFRTLSQINTYTLWRRSSQARLIQHYRDVSAYNDFNYFDIES